ncbi:hypothetical protein L1987_16007 [Smallanthus sonchifolius]|uniref:Uncharacterized protein n=1 Tax=Smallanthus sonchifolius TaxID=185202 RepID=A0ACB9J7N9_9ASTR|nr:hypothetical protein L1987_16007 [Smallanthus sonchifolius]
MKKEPDVKVSGRMINESPTQFGTVSKEWIKSLVGSHGSNVDCFREKGRNRELLEDESKIGTSWKKKNLSKEQEMQEMISNNEVQVKKEKKVMTKMDLERKNEEGLGSGSLVVLFGYSRSRP